MGQLHNEGYSGIDSYVYSTIDLPNVLLIAFQLISRTGTFPLVVLQLIVSYGAPLPRIIVYEGSIPPCGPGFLPLPRIYNTLTTLI